MVNPFENLRFEIPISPLISAEELLTIKSSPDLILIDARSSKDAENNYNQQHLAHALFAPLEYCWSAPVINAREGGRHPLPSFSDLQKTAEKLGIHPNSKIVIYDDQNSAMAAARAWWVLTSAGHPSVQVINGGLSAAIKVGYPIESQTPPLPARGSWIPTSWILPTEELKDILENPSSSRHPLIDVRDADRYRGEREPIDPIAGHIPGAFNLPYTELFTEEGYFHSKDILQNKIRNTIPHPVDSVRVHCGSGVTAAVMVLAFTYLNNTIPHLYVGSWGEWCRNDLPIATR
jgi:thiosulfate/3-mercaptopyruvate sulfurtransferase